jgi:hypothetical protein
VAGFLAGGFLSAFLKRWLPESAAKEFFTTTASSIFGPVSMDLLVVNFTLGPLGVHISLLSLIGVLLAYIIARSLF